MSPPLKLFKYSKKEDFYYSVFPFGERAVVSIKLEPAGILGDVRIEEPPLALGDVG